MSQRDIINKDWEKREYGGGGGRDKNHMSEVEVEVHTDCGCETGWATSTSGEQRNHGGVPPKPTPDLFFTLKSSDIRTRGVTNGGT